MVSVSKPQHSSLYLLFWSYLCRTRRSIDQSIREEQDRAYQESLIADREKEKKKQEKQRREEERRGEEEEKKRKEEVGRGRGVVRQALT